MQGAKRLSGGTGAVDEREPRTSSRSQCARRRASRARARVAGCVGLDDPHVPVVARRRSGFQRARQIQMFRISIPQSVVPELRVRFGCRTTSSTGWPRFPAWNPSVSRRASCSVNRGPTGPFSLEDKPDAPPLSPVFRYASPDYFATLGTPIVAGRDLEWADHYGTQQVAVISQNFRGARVGLGGGRASASACAERRPRRGSRSSASPATCGSMAWNRPRRTRSTCRPNESVALFVVRDALFRRSQRARGHAGLPQGDRAGGLVRERQSAARQRADTWACLRSRDGADVADARPARDHRRDGARARPRRHLRRLELCARATHARDRHPHRARRSAGAGEALDATATCSRSSVLASCSAWVAPRC